MRDPKISILIHIFIETGLFLGNGAVQALEYGFKKVHSCDINKDFVIKCENIKIGRASCRERV